MFRTGMLLMFGLVLQYDLTAGTLCSFCKLHAPSVERGQVANKLISSPEILTMFLLN